MIFTITCDISEFLCEITLARVTRRWRSVALSTPQLWTAICFDHPILDMAKIYLARSGALPLCLHIDFAHWYMDHETMYRLIQLHAGRWCCLKIGSCTSVSTLYHIIEALNLEHSTSSILQSVQIDMDPDEAYEGLDPVVKSLLGHCHCAITSLKLRGFGLDCLVPLTSMTTLHLHDPSGSLVTLASVASTLNQLPELITLVISGDYISLPSQTADKVIVQLPSLQTLHFRTHRNYFPPFLAAMTAPMINLILVEDVYRSEMELINLWNSVPKFPSLRSLVLIFSPDNIHSRHQWDSTLQMIPGLVTNICTGPSPKDLHSHARLDTLTLVYPPDRNVGELPTSFACCSSWHTLPIHRLQLSKNMMDAMVGQLESVRTLFKVDEISSFEDFGEGGDDYHLISWARHSDTGCYSHPTARRRGPPRFPFGRPRTRQFV